ncbi:MFS transporter [Candidatus Gracilibacteria bacterium CG17_big_fil_post_rev_8_21_14_2_50_48_13]|nr:MAG: MFS transporter [Candidatus Gracilibacteria bacterium CG17_big_fil_post_rev_8_21_14_2_50_48_13]
MPKAKQKENPWINILVNVVFPTIILMKISPMIGHVAGLLLALSLPLFYGIWDLWKRRTWNFFSLLGLASILLTGGIGLFSLPPDMVAWKEALVPGLVGVVVLITAWTPFPLMKKLLEQVMPWSHIEDAAREKGKESELLRLTKITTVLLACSSFVSAVLNYVLAKLIVMSPAGTDAFNEELGKMTGLSLPVILVPNFLMLFGLMFYLMWSLAKITGLDIEDLIQETAQHQA